MAPPKTPDPDEVAEITIVTVSEKELRETQQKAAKILEKARVLVALDEAYYAVILFNLEYREDLFMPTMGTDGKYLYYNPFFIINLSPDDVRLGLVHEASHIALKHPLRCREGKFKQERYNRAGDYVINLLLSKDKYVIPSWALLDTQYEGMTTEQVYRLLTDAPEQEQMQGEGGEGEGGEGQEGQEGSSSDSQDGSEDAQDAPGGDSGGQDGSEGREGADEGAGKPRKLKAGRVKVAKPTGKAKQESHPCAGQCQVRPHPSKDTSVAEQEIDTILKQAYNVAKQRGRLPGSMVTVLDKMNRYQVDYRRILPQWLRSATSHDNYSWGRPSKRMLAVIGMPLPSLYDEGAGKGVLVRDTSGSCASRDLQAQFHGELNGILESCNIEELVVIDCDAKVQEVRKYAKYDFPVLPHGLKGWGGTSFKPPFTWVEENLEYKPDFLVYLTDLQGDFPEEEPPYPVLWITPDDQLEAPFGITARITVGPE